MIDPEPTQPLLDGRYRMEECVGRGGMSRVHRARDVVLGRVVAIKTWESDAEGPSGGRPQIETTVLASLSHPALVTLFDAQLAPGRSQYLVMEFIDGPTLAARIAAGPMPPPEVAALAVDLAEALSVVHDAGIVHRDVKPSNVLLSSAPQAGRLSGAKLADFGISALVDAERITSPGMLIGTAAYLAPEQVRGAAPAPPADIYSLGLVLLEALTGRRPYPEAVGIGTAIARLDSAPPIPESVGPSWTTLLSQMTAMEPEARPSALEVASAASALLPAGATGRRSLPVSPFIATPGDASENPPTRVMAIPSGHDADRAPRPDPDDGTARHRRRRLGLVGASAAGVMVAALIAGVWAAGGGAPGEIEPTAPVTTGRTATPEPTSTLVAEEQEVAVVPAGEQTTGTGGSGEKANDAADDPKADEAARKKAEQAARKKAQDDRKAEKAEKAEKATDRGREGNRGKGGD